MAAKAKKSLRKKLGKKAQVSAAGPVNKQYSDFLPLEVGQRGEKDLGKEDNVPRKTADEERKRRLEARIEAARLAEAKGKAVEDARKKASDEAEEAARKNDEEMKKKKLAEDAAEEEEKAVEEAARKEDEEGKRKKAEDAARKEEQEGLRKKAKEEAARKEEEGQRKKAEEEAARKEEQEGQRRKAEAAARKVEEEGRRKKAEEEAARKKEEEGQRKKAEEAARKEEKEGQWKKAKEEAARKEDQEGQRRKVEAARKVEEEWQRKKAEEAATKKEEEGQRKKVEEAARKEEKERQRRKAEEEAARKEEEEGQRKKAEDAARSAPIEKDDTLVEGSVRSAPPEGTNTLIEGFTAVDGLIPMSKAAATIVKAKKTVAEADLAAPMAIAAKLSDKHAVGFGAKGGEPFVPPAKQSKGKEVQGASVTKLKQALISHTQALNKQKSLDSKGKRPAKRSSVFLEKGEFVSPEESKRQRLEADTAEKQNSVATRTAGPSESRREISPRPKELATYRRRLRSAPSYTDGELRRVLHENGLLWKRIRNLEKGQRNWIGEVTRLSSQVQFLMETRSAAPPAERFMIMTGSAHIHKDVARIHAIIDQFLRYRALQDVVVSDLSNAVAHFGQA